MKIAIDGNTDTMTLDDVEICLPVLRKILRPDPAVSYRFERIENIVHITIAHEAPRLNESPLTRDRMVEKLLMVRGVSREAAELIAAFMLREYDIREFREVN